MQSALGWPDAEPSPWTEEVVSDEIVEALARVVIRLRTEQGEPVVTTLSDGAYREWAPGTTRTLR